MYEVRRSAPLRYGFAVGSTALAVGLRLLLGPLLGDHLPFVTVFVAVVLTAWVAGRGPALVSVAVGAVLTCLLVLPARAVQAAWLQSVSRELAVALFGLSATGCAVLIDLLRRTQRQAEAATAELLTSQELLRGFLDNSPAAAYMKDEAGRYVLVNRYSLRTLHMTEAEFLGKTDYQLFPEEQARRFRQSDLTVLATDAPQELEQPMTVGEKTHHFVNLKFPFRDAAGRRFVAGLSVDVTGRRQASEEAREQREWLRVTLASIADAVVTTDTAGRITYLNPVAEALTGWASATATGQPLGAVFSAVDEASGQPIEDPVRRALRGDASDGPATPVLFIARDGSRRAIEHTAAPIRGADDRTVGAVLVFRDVTARRQGERLLAITAERLHLALAAGRMGVWEWNLDSNQLWWSDGLEPIHGLVPGSFDGTLQMFERLIHPADRDFVRRSIAAAVDKRSDYDIEFRTLWPDGSEHWIGASGRVSCDDQGVPRRMVGTAFDITDRRRAAEALRESEARFAGMVSHAPALIFMKDRDGRYIMANRVVQEKMGISSTGILGKTDVELFGTAVAEELRRIDEQVMASGQARQYEETLVLNGRPSTFLTTKFPFPDPTGRSAALCGIALDISERKKAEEALRQSEEEYRILAEGLPLFVLVTSPDGRVEYCNRRWLDFTGLGPEEVTADSARRFLHPDDAEATIRSWEDGFASGQPFTIEYRLRGLHQPAYRFYVARAVPIHDSMGQVVKWVTALADIDARRRAEETVRSLLHISEQLNSTLDVEGLLDILVQRAIHLIGARSGIAGLYTTTTTTTTTGTPPGPAMVCHRLFRDGQPVPLEHRFPPMHGLPGWLIVHKRPYLTNDASQDPQVDRELCAALGIRALLSIPILSVDGDILGFFELHDRLDGSPFDRDDQEKLVAVAQAAAIAIQNALAYRKLQLAEAALKEADRRKDDFLATLAHELRNPLAPIRNALQVIRLAESDPATVKRAREMMERQLQQMVRLIDDLLDVSRITRNKLGLQRERIELGRVVASAVETSLPLIESMGHRLTLALPAQPIYLHADFTRLSQVFANLLNNAAKYTERGGRITLGAERHGSEVVVSVRDTGIGISRENLRRVFEMFAQVTPPLDRAQGGLGIGLALARGLVEMHDGHIEAHSEGPGRGSEFIVRLPVLADPPSLPPSSPGAAAEGTPAAAPLRILVVDDNRDSTESLALMLRMAGHTVRTAYDGQEAVAAAAEFRPEVLLLDIGLPKQNGYEVARQVRQLPGGERAVLLALTGWGGEGDKRLAREAGFDHHLTKPVDPAALFALLHRLRPPVP